MDLRTCRELLKEVESELAQLEGAVREREIHARYLRRRLQELEQQTLPLTPSDKALPPDLSHLSIAEATARVIRSAGRPMRSKEISAQLVKVGFEDKETLSLTVTSAMLRRKDLFQKIDRGLFALKNGVSHE